MVSPGTQWKRVLLYFSKRILQLKPGSLVAQAVASAAKQSAHAQETLRDIVKEAKGNAVTILRFDPQEDTLVKTNSANPTACKDPGSMFTRSHFRVSCILMSKATSSSFAIHTFAQLNYHHQDIPALQWLRFFINIFSTNAGH